MSQTKRAYDKFLLYALLIIALGVIGFISATTVIDPSYINTTGPILGSTGTFSGALTGTTLDTGQGANELFDMDQNVLQASAVTFSTVNTGQGANDLWDMNQNVQTTSSVTFDDVTVSDELMIDSEAITNWDDLTSYIAFPSGGVTSIIGRNATKIASDNYFYCDGTADQVQFQEALDFANSRGGGQVFMEFATDYSVSAVPAFHFEDMDNIRLTGENPIITLEDDILDSTLGNWATILIDNCSRIEIDHITLDINGENQNFDNGYGDGDQYGTGITVISGGKYWSAGFRDGPWSTDLNFHDMSILNAHYVGISINKVNRTSVDHVKILDIWTGDGGGYKGIVNTWTRDAWTTNNLIDFRTNHTIWLGSSNGIFGFCAINSEQSGNERWVISGNTIIGSKDSAIELNGLSSSALNWHSDFIISDNIIDGRCIFLSYDVFNGIVDGNIIHWENAGVKEGAAALAIGGGEGTFSGHVTFSNNHVYIDDPEVEMLRDLGQISTISAQVTDVSFIGNEFKGAGRYNNIGRGIRINGYNASLDLLDGILIEGNRFTDSTSIAFFIEETNENAHIDIIGNTVRNTGVNGTIAETCAAINIRDDGWFNIRGNSFIDDRATKETDYGVYVYGGASGWIVDNIFNVTTGVYLGSTSGKWTIQDNDFSGCTTALNDQGADKLCLNTIQGVPNKYSGGSSSLGYEIDLEGEYVSMWTILPLDAYEVEYIKIRGRGMLTDADGLMLNITMYSYGDDESYTTDAVIDYQTPSSIGSVNGRGLSWYVTAADCDLSFMEAGNSVVVKPDWSDVLGAYNATDVEISGFELGYLKGTR